MNEENEWDHKISAEVKEGPADCIMMDEVRAALKKMKRHKAPGLQSTYVTNLASCFVKMLHSVVTEDEENRSDTQSRSY